MTFWQDVRFAVRMILRERSFAAIVITTLALGIAVNGAVFTLANAVVLRDLPFEQPDRVVHIGTRDARNRDRGTSYPDYQSWREAAKTVNIGAFSDTTMNVSDDRGAPERFIGAYVSAHAFGLIGRRPMMGRDFRPEDDTPGAPAVVILGSDVWKSRYDLDPSIVGRTIRVNEVPSTVIGIMPDGFGFPLNAAMWQPLALMPALQRQSRDARRLGAFGRITDGSSLEQTRAEMATISQRLSSEFPDTNKDIQARVIPFKERFIGPEIGVIFMALMGAVGFVLLVACGNVANLMLSRAASRFREVSIRSAIGATRWRIVRQLLVESFVLAAVAGVVALGLSLLGVRLFERAIADTQPPYWLRFTFDSEVFVFMAAVCLGTAVVFGLAPALHISKPALREFLTDGAHGSSAGLRARRWTSALIVCELALSLVLLAGAAFMMRSFLALYQLDLGFDSSRVTSVWLALSERKYSTPEQRMAFQQRLDERLRAVPAIASASPASALPLGAAPTRQLHVEGRPADGTERQRSVSLVTVGPRYFETLGLRLLGGRAFVESDGAPGSEHAIVNQRLAALYFPNEDPIGRRIRLMTDNAAAPAPWFTIVGVAPTVRQQPNFDSPDPDPVAYVPYRFDPAPSYALLVRGQSDPAALTALLREEVRALDSDLPLFDVRTMDQWLAYLRWPHRVFGTMFSIFASIALVLALVGLYGVIAYSVTQRTREIGIRIALGAKATQVQWVIIRRAIIAVALGLVIGMAGALAVGMLLQSVLIGTGAGDLVTLAAISLLFVIVSVAACVWPARRAARLDAAAALRQG